MKIQSKLTLSLLALSVGVLLAAGIFSTLTLETYFRSRIISELETQAQQIEFVIRTMSVSDTDRYNHLQQFAHTANLRLTLIDKTGKVIFESDLPLEQLLTVENHLHRPEVQDALCTGRGISTRRSSTVNVEMLYLAKSLASDFPESTGFSNATILRLSIPLTHVDQVMGDIRTKILITSIVVLIAVFIATIVISKRVSRPISEMASIAELIRSGNLDRRIAVRSHDELGELGETLNSMIDKLNDDISKLKKLERVRSEFLGNVSHELRTPIFAIQGMLETLLQGAIDDKEVNRDFIGRALRNTQNLNHLLGDLIEISRIESGEMKMSFRYFVLQEFLEQLIIEMQPLAQQKGIFLTLTDAVSNSEVLGDKERLKQVIVNLIDNAIKYTKAGGKVSISAIPVDHAVKITVQDSGVGIPEEHLPRIFERFYRVDKERSREAGGTGLGLAIVKHIVEAHGSKVEVKSETGKGSTFSFILKT